MSKSLHYRPEIDGLRALSVLLVIFHHLGVTFFSGGYIGVDVFFVISGYLITSIITKEVSQQKFSIKGFYKRRIVRLAPAYFIVIATTSLVSMFALLPSELINYLDSVTYSTFFLANFYMWSEAGGYFGSQADFIPLLHLWSLAVEEQFYILWPIILVVFYKLFKFKGITLFVLFSALLCLIVSEYGAQKYTAAAYYLMPTRAVELMLGALLVFLPKYQFSILIRNFLTLLGLSLIVYTAVMYTTATVFPGINALTPCFGAMLIIHCADYKKDFVGKVLSVKPVNFIGKISYPAYLWHWPIIVFCNIYLINISFLIGLLILFITLIISFLTFQYIENPAKKALNWRLGKIFLVGFIVPALVLLVLTYTSNVNDGFPERFSESLALKSKAILSFSYKERGRCNEGPVTNPLGEDECVLGVNKASVDFLLVGDSHANHYTGMIDEFAKNANISGYDITQHQTVYLPDARFFYKREGRDVESVNFYRRNQKISEIIKSGLYKKVILAGAFPNSISNLDYRISTTDSYNPKKVFKKQFTKSIEIIIASGATPYIINDNPTYKKEVHKCGILNERFNLTQNCNMPIAEYRNQVSDWMEFVEYLQKQFPQLNFINPNDIICDDKKCVTEIDEIPLYRDSTHLNQIGSRLIGKKYLEKLGNPLI